MRINKTKLEIEMARNKISIAALAEKAKVAVHSVSGVCNGKECSPRIAGQIAEALCIDVTKLI